MVQVVELEPNSSVTPSGGINELDLQLACIEEESLQMFRSFLASIGSMISAVDLSHNSLADEFESLQGIITYCTHLQHLVLNNVDLATSEWELLMDALHRGDLGHHLISLNLNDNRLDATKITEIAELLSDAESIPALEELRLGVNSMDGPKRERLANALRVNDALAVLEL